LHSFHKEKTNKSTRFQKTVAMMLASTSVLTATQKSPPPQVLGAYVLFLTCSATMYHLVANGEFSSILTMGVMLQCFGFALLAMQTLMTGSAAGLSARGLGLDALALCLRLSSTLWLQGYLPVDASGDWFFQAVDVCSLALVLWLLHRVLVEKRRSYQEKEDTFPIAPMTLLSFVLAAIFHADMNSRPLFDALWMAGLFVSVVAVMPQLWLIARTGGHVEALTSHYIAAMALGRALSGIFMWHARFDITCVPWMEGVNHAPWAILTAHALHLVLLGDFAYYYVKSIATKGLGCSLELGEDCNV
jgi:hypothetical protein